MMNGHIINVMVDADPKRNQWTVRELVEKLWETRDREITRLWQRGVFLATFILGEFTAYGVIEGSLMTCARPESFAANVLGVALGMLGLISALFWIAMAKGANAWYQVYERAIGGLFALSELPEMSKILAETCPSVGFARDFKWSNGFLRGCGGTYSLPRINVAIGQLCALVWMLLICAHAVLLLCGLSGFDLATNLDLVKTIVAIGLCMFCAVVLIGFRLYSARFLQSKSLLEYVDKEKAKSNGVIFAGLDFLARLRFAHKD